MGRAEENTVTHTQLVAPLLDIGGGVGGLGLARRQETGIPKVNGPFGAGCVAPPDKRENGAVQAPSARPSASQHGNSLVACPFVEREFSMTKIASTC